MARLMRWCLASTISRGRRESASLMSISSIGSYRSSYRSPRNAIAERSDRGVRIRNPRRERRRRERNPSTVITKAFGDGFAVQSCEPVAGWIEEGLHQRRRRHRRTLTRPFSASCFSLFSRINTVLFFCHCSRPEIENYSKVPRLLLYYLFLSFLGFQLEVGALVVFVLYGLGRGLPSFGF